MAILPLPDELSAADLIGWGSFGVLARYPGANKVIKLPHFDEGEEALGCLPQCTREKEAYERLGSVSSDGREHIIGYLGSIKQGILLEYADNGSIESFARSAKAPVSEGRRFLWAWQAARALAFCHSRGVMHGDIRCSNFLLDRGLNLKLAEFTGASIDGSGSLSYYNSAFLLPESVEDVPAGTAEHSISPQTEIFAFGSVLYEMATGHKPYAESEDDEIERRFGLKQFPDVTRLGRLAPVMIACWHLEYESMADVLKDIEARARTFRSQQALAGIFTFALVLHAFHTFRR